MSGSNFRVMLKDFRRQYLSLRFSSPSCGSFFRCNLFFIGILQYCAPICNLISFRQLMLCDGGLQISTPTLDVHLSTAYVVGGLLVDRIFYIT